MVLKIKVTSTNQKENCKEYELRPGLRLTIGRAPTNKIVLVDSMVSGSHGIISTEKIRNKVQASYIDVGSTNGSIFNGKPSPVGKKWTLKKGDIITLGECKLICEEGAAAFSAEQHQDLMQSLRFGGKIVKNEEKTAEQLEEEKMTVKELMEKEFARIIGQEAIKDQLKQFHKKVQLDRIRAANGKPGDQKTLFHMIFQGPPGTGKTTMANVVAKVMLKMQLVKSDKVVFVNNALELLAGYAGQTAGKVDEKVEEAKGGVLFIDEAYSIVKSKDGNQKDSFGKEALETIMKHLDPPSCVFIFAGYEKEMAEFLEVNSGLSRRIPFRYTFETYSCIELATIFLKMCESHCENLDFKNPQGEVEKILSGVHKEFMSTQNAGLCNNWLDFAQIERDDRIDIDEAQKNPKIACTLNLNDLVKGIKRLLENQNDYSQDES